MNPKWTPKQLASYLNVKVGTVYLWVKEGRIPFVVLSKGPRKQCVRFDPDEIEKWLQKRRRGLR
jgi:excisionase family DNA binding protein